jgi:hypothetical protein
VHENLDADETNFFLFRLWLGRGLGPCHGYPLRAAKLPWSQEPLKTNAVEIMKYPEVQTAISPSASCVASAIGFL